MKDEVKRLEAEVARLQEEIFSLKDEMIRLVRPNYNIASIAEDSGFNHVRTMQRRIMDVVGMTPAEYRALFTR